MNIRPRNIPKFDEGGTFNLEDWINNNTNYFNWYSSLYPNALTLAGEPLKQRNNYWNKSQLSSSHYTTDDLKRSAYNNYEYTNDYSAREADLIHWAESLSDLGTISDQDFVNRYNTQAQKIRDAREAPQTYNKTGYTDSNRTFRNMFFTRSKLGTNVPLYTIGYLPDLEDIEGTSTWQRRMDRYEKKFLDDTPEGLKNRIFTITKPNGKQIKVYKKENGDIGLFSEIENQIKPDSQTEPTNRLTGQHNETYGFDWNKVKEGASKLFNNPNLLGSIRLAGNLINNGRIYDEQLKGLQPELINPYRTHRQVVGDEATKQAYYKRAALGETKAGRAITSDADRQLAYQMEAKRIGDELREKGDLADNAEIRRTSDESNQHQWANIQRATEVANANRIAINRNNAARHNLLALKHAAQWSSIDNFLQELEYRKRLKLAREQSVEDELFALQAQSDLMDDPEVQAASKHLREVIKKNSDKDGNWETNEEILEASRQLKRARIAATKRSLEAKKDYVGTRIVKTGGKITRKRKEKDDLLYKSAEDVVKHFLIMTKLSSDALNRKPVKIQKLASHPKGSTRKYLLGGVAPFTIYKPVALGGETTTSSEISTSNTTTKSSEDKTKQDLLKELFKSLLAEGIPSDVNAIYSLFKRLFDEAELFGTELTTDDIQSMYISAMLKLNTVKFNKKLFDKVAEIIYDKNAVEEYAIDLYGRLAFQDTDNGKIVYKKPSELKERDSQKLRALTNGDLLNLRAYGHSFDADMLQVASNATSMSEIAKYLKENLPNLGTSESKLQGYTNKETVDIKLGIELLKNAPNGDYKLTITTKQLEEQAKMAIGYLKSILPKNMKSLLDIKASMSGGYSSDALIASLVGSNISSTIDIEYQAVTGKASEGKDGNSGGLDSEKVTPAVALAMGLGEKESINISDKTSDALNISVVSLPLLDSSHHAMANATLKQVGDGDYSGQFDLGQATMGGVKISTNAINEVLIDRGRIYSAELPIDLLAYLQTGVLKPNLSFLKNIEKAEAEIKASGITGDRNKLNAQLIQTINKIYLKNNLPIIYNVGGDGKPVLTSQYRRFAMLHASAPENVFEEDVTFNDGALKASKEDRTRFESMMREVTNNNKYKLDDGWIGGIGGTELYKGIIYMPMTNSTISALASTGYKDNPTSLNEIESADQQAEFIRSSGYKNPGSWK